jgi:hypothetical protein
MLCPGESRGLGTCSQTADEIARVGDTSSHLGHIDVLHQ